MDWSARYTVGCVISGIIIFFSSWIYCISEYGYLLGVGLGWLPSIISAYVLCWFWPIYLLAIISLIIYVFQFV
ncbi:MAG: hypothetical protein ACI8SR_000525 [Oceanicoccus sp.]|jgi:hypothetical protein